MRALARSPFVSALAGGAVVAVAMLALGPGGGGSGTTTVLEQAPASAGGVATQAEREVAEAGPGTGVTAVSAREVYARYAPGVVFVRAQQPVDGDGGGAALTQQASGTGFVIDDAGHVLTNHHVVGEARTARVSFGDETTVTATVLGDDPTNDLALLRVEPGRVDLQPLPLGDSASARVGDPVVAIGNPYGLERTLTTGVVSALQRSLKAPNGFTIPHAIQTDAPINPGSSGGPLFDAGGRVIGITSQIATDGTGGSVGIGFAVPIDTATRLLPELLRRGSVAHAYLGITGLTIDESLHAVQLRATSGVLVQTVYARSPAARAGLRGGTIESQVGGNRVQLGGDVITSLDGRTIGSMEELTAALARHRPGDEVRLGVMREGDALRLTVRLGTAPRQAPADPQAP